MKSYLYFICLIVLVFNPVVSFSQDDEILKLKNELQTAKGEARLEALNQIASRYLYTSFLLSERYARIGLRESIVQKDTMYQMKFYRKIGGVKQFSSQYDSAVYYFHKSADLAILFGDEYSEAISRLNLGNIYTYTDHYDLALKTFFSSLQP